MSIKKQNIHLQGFITGKPDPDEKNTAIGTFLRDSLPINRSHP